VVIPAALVEEVAKLGTEQEALEAWLMAEVKAGRALPGLYPPNEETLARYNARRKT
jgi:regulator of RNase E activity RraA